MILETDGRTDQLVAGARGGLEDLGPGLEHHHLLGGHSYHHHLGCNLEVGGRRKEERCKR